MRPFLLSIIPSVFAIHSYHKPNASTSTQTLARLQYHAPRAIIDTCIALNANTSLKTADNAPSLASALSDTCLCLKDLDLYLRSNNDIQTLVKELGINTVIDLLLDIINSPDSRQCSAPPPHARRTCTTDDPCHWSCEDNFTREGDVCVCSPPKTMCNGVCSETCAIVPSSLPRVKRKERITTLAQANATCKASETVCGIPGREGTLDFECNSCGGCMSAHPFAGEPQPFGKDCSQLSNALEVQCTNRSCVVHRCKEGFEPSETQRACIRSRMKKIRKRQEPFTTSGVVYADSRLRGQLVTIFNLALKLKQDYVLLSSSDVDIVYKHRFAKDSVYLLLQSLANVLTSPDVASLVINTNALLESTFALDKRFKSCECVDDLGLHNLVADTDSLLAATIDLNRWLASNSLGTVVTPGATNNSSSEHATVNETANLPIVLDLSGLLDQLGLGSIKSDLTIGGLDSGTNALVNSLLDSLGIGPNLTLRLVLDTNDIIKNSENLTIEVLRESVGYVVQATVALFEAFGNGQTASHEVSSLTNSSETAMRLLESCQQGDQLAPIILYLDQMMGVLSAMNASSLSSDLNNLVNKGLEIDSAASGLGLDTNFGFSLYSMLAALGL
ncbi:hypothetical protein F5887DRAFT_956286 [Amanita rubescens]|nr:hypothetical protein F5887DRAFT_956286 [Amanita rubescens]